MKLKDQVMFANLAIFAGMVVAYFQGVAILTIALCGGLAFLLVTWFFFRRMREAKRQGEGTREQGREERGQRTVNRTTVDSEERAWLSGAE